VREQKGPKVSALSDTCRYPREQRTTLCPEAIERFFTRKTLIPLLTGRRNLETWITTRKTSWIRLVSIVNSGLE